jgi:septum formation protein
MDLVLASKSPRRASLLQGAGLTFRVVVAGVDEHRAPGEVPDGYALRLAREKRDAVMPLSPRSVVVAADTVVALGEEVLEKPVDAADARRMLRTLSGQVHRVHTAVAVGGPNGRHECVVTTQVAFRALSDGEIARYVATGEPMDKAGSYGIQGEGGALTDWVQGSYTAVVGLPLKETLELIARVSS